MTEIVVDASQESPEVEIFVKKANDGHFYIERTPKRQNTSTDRFPISEEFAEKLQKMSTENAWFAIEKYLGVAPI